MNLSFACSPTATSSVSKCQQTSVSATRGAIWGRPLVRAVAKYLDQTLYQYPSLLGCEALRSRGTHTRGRVSHGSHTKLPSGVQSIASSGRHTAMFSHILFALVASFADHSRQGLYYHGRVTPRKSQRRQRVERNATITGPLQREQVEICTHHQTRSCARGFLLRTSIIDTRIYMGDTQFTINMTPRSHR